MIKVVAPNVALRVLDRAIQAFGGAGVCQDPGLAKLWAGQRTLRLADGPDEVHRASIAKVELSKGAAKSNGVHAANVH
jgi:acyl-CoA dehydrogenase